jgi:serine/threonine protein phosphatase 1
MSKYFKEHDFTGLPGRCFVVGDIHGRFDLLDAELESLGFDKSKDHLFSVGDLVDRGPFSHLAVEYVNQPWFHHVCGNHELMTTHFGGTDWHVRNGGQWYNDLETDYDRKKAGQVLSDAPWVMEVTLPSGKKVGMMHAGLPVKNMGNYFLTPHWDDMATYSDEWYASNEDAFMWDRYQVSRAQKASERPNDWRLKEFVELEGVDALYFGHTPLKKPLTVGKFNWLDTGAFATNVLTVQELL